MSESWVLTVTGPAWLNANDRKDRRGQAKLVSKWREEAGWEAKIRQIPAQQRIRVVATVIVKDRKRRDPANWHPTAKACVDGLVDAGVVADDDYQHVTGPDMRLRIDSRVVVPTLELLILPVPYYTGSKWEPGVQL